MTGRSRYATRARRLGRAAVLLTLVAGLVLGAEAAAFGDWSPTENIGVGIQTFYGAHVAYDGAGNAYMLYEDTAQRIYLRTRPPAGAWGAPELLVDPAIVGFTNDPSMAVNSAGDIVVAFRAGDIYAMRRPAGGSWGPKTSWRSPGNSPNVSGCPLAPSAAIGNDGTAAVAWTTNTSCNGNVTPWRVLGVAFTATGGWETTPQAWGVSPTGFNNAPAVAVDDTGAVTVAFSAQNASSGYDLWTVERDSAWQAPVLRSNAGGGNLYRQIPGITSQGTNTAVAWYGDSTFVIEKSAGVWGSVHALSGVAHPSNDYGPAIALDGSGTTYVARTLLGTSALVVKLSTITPDGTVVDFPLSDPSLNSGGPALAANAQGDVAIAWDVLKSGKWYALSELQPAGGVWPDAPTQITTAASDSTTLAAIAVDQYGHALVGATPRFQTRGIELDVSIETRDPASPPDATPPSLAPVAVQAGNTLTCDPGVFHGTAPFRYSYEWLLDSVTIAGATGASYTVVPTDAGQGVSCHVTATNEAGTADATSAEVVVDYTPPGAVSPPSITGTVEAGQIIDCDPGTWSGVPDPDLSYEWLRNGTLIPDETADTYYVDVPDGNTQLACRVTATNGGGSAAQTSSARLVPAVVVPAAKTKPVLSGPAPAALGDTLACTDGTWLGAPTPVLAHGWARNGVAIPFEYGLTYVVQPADAGTTVTCTVTGINVAAETTVTAAGTRAIAPKPANTILPTVGADAGSTWGVGKSAKCYNGGWTNAATFRYQWLRNGVQIAGATTQTRILTSFDAGTTISCIVTATGRGGTTSATSPGKAVVAAPAPVVAPSVSGVARPGHVLTCARGTWSNASSLAVSWTRQNVVVSTGSQTYTVKPADVGTVMRCRVVATGAGGSTTYNTAGVTVQP